MALTIFNCGTAFNRSSKDIVAKLHTATASPKYINDGPGSTGRKKINNVPGLVAGAGVDRNVANAVAEVKRHNDNNGLVVNMLGWSRGAVTCFKIANALFKDRDPAAKNLRINIYAIDPVPGGAPVNNHMWKGIEFTPNIKHCEAIFAQHDHRSTLFTPYIPNPEYADIEIMPGHHSDLVLKGTKNHVAHELVGHLACSFLSAHGTLFSSTDYLLTPTEILRKYAIIHETYDSYAKGKRDFVSRFKKFRPLHSVDRKREFKLQRRKPAFFINHHHRTVFKAQFPRIAEEIEKISRGYPGAIDANRIEREFHSLSMPHHFKTFCLVSSYLGLVEEPAA